MRKGYFKLSVDNCKCKREGKKFGSHKENLILWGSRQLWRTHRCSVECTHLISAFGRLPQVKPTNFASSISRLLHSRIQHYSQLTHSHHLLTQWDLFPAIYTPKAGRHRMHTAPICDTRRSWRFVFKTGTEKIRRSTSVYVQSVELLLLRRGLYVCVFRNFVKSGDLKPA